jgi:hypothetical protein
LIAPDVLVTEFAEPERLTPILAVALPEAIPPREIVALLVAVVTCAVLLMSIP